VQGSGWVGLDDAAGVGVGRVGELLFVGEGPLVQVPSIVLGTSPAGRAGA
jgi:hypothetical protein